MEVTCEFLAGNVVVEKEGYEAAHIGWGADA
jgi:hypothetical protein